MESHLLQMRGLKLTIQKERIITSVSHLLQMRGLKRIKGYINASGNRSHLLQMRGLKPSSLWKREGVRFGSHLLQMRGLKPSQISTNTVASVASFTDAWIETSRYPGSPLLVPPSRIFYRCVD